MKKVLVGLAAVVALGFGVAAPAAAHVEPTIADAPAGGFVTFGLHVGHGCEDDSDTTMVEVQIPEGVESATPEALPGWTASVDDGPDGLVVTWEGGPLPHDQFLEFGLSLQMPDTPGETALFPTIQTCESGASTAWIEAATEEGEEPENPAPAIAITEATDDGHGHEGAAPPEAEATDEAAADDSHADEDEGDDERDSLAVVALVVGALALLVGAYAVLRVRRPAA